MKIRKLSLGLGLVLGAVAVVSLASCNGSGSTKVTYKDADGNEKSVEVKKTENKEEVAEAATAIIYSDGTKFKPYGIALDAQISAKFNGKQNDKAFNYSYNVGAKSQVSVGKEYKSTDYAEYSELSLSAQLPKDIMKLYATADQSGASAGVSIDFTQNTNLAATIKTYGDLSEEYLKIEKLDIPYADLGLTDYKEMIETYAKVDSIYKVNYQEAVNTFGSLISKYSGMSQLNLATLPTQVQSLLASYKTMEDPVASIYGNFTKEDAATFKANFETSVETYGISITNVSGTSVTFRAVPNEKYSEGLKGYTGNSYIDVTFDAVKKIPTAISADLKDVLNHLANSVSTGDSSSTNVFAQFGVTDFAVAEMKFSLNLTFDKDVTSKLTDAEKASATNLVTTLSDLMGQKK